MTFSIEVYIFAFIVLIFAGLFWWVSGREKGFPRFLLVLISLTFFVLSLFGVLVGLAFSVEYSATADCENVINSTTLVGNVTSYTYVDSCASTDTPTSLSMLYVVYNYLLLFLVMVSVFSLMFIGLTKVILKW